VEDELDPRAVRQPTVDLRARLATAARAFCCRNQDLFCDGVRVSWLPCLARSGRTPERQEMDAIDYRANLTRRVSSDVKVASLLPLCKP
jgi:hypothetical protein